MGIMTNRAVGIGGRALLAGLIAFGAWRATRGPAPVEHVAARPPAIAHAVAPAPPPAPAPAPPPADSGPFVVRRILDLDAPMHHGDYAWDEAGVPAGPIVITVDLAAETLSVFRDGYEIGTAVILFGANGKPTPLGTFPILQKDADHVSSLYDAPMPYMLRLTNDGVAIHASKVEWDAGTHGCIGVPRPFAEKLFAAAHVGDRVIVTRGKRLGLGQAIATPTT